MPSPEKCKIKYKELGYKSVADCISYKKSSKKGKKSNQTGELKDKTPNRRQYSY
jgi:hypothetical protein